MNETLRPADSESRLLDDTQRRAFTYFIHETNPVNGLVIDTTTVGAPSSIAAVGLALTSYPAAVERGYIARQLAAARTLTTLRFFWRSKQGPEADATGYHGFYYHFLDMHSGTRAWACELSTVDSSLLIAGMLTAAAYFDGGSDVEREIGELSEQLYARVDWQWALDGGLTLTHGWKPELGFLPYRWEGYDEALVLYVLALGSDTHPIPPASYRAWMATYEWRTVYDTSFLYAGPLFIHQLSHVWIDFRGIQDAYMRERRSDYFENSRRATVVQQQYAMRNPHGFAQYGEADWGVTASNGPGNVTCDVGGVAREFFGYLARGVPDGPDDGTLAPWGVIASLPFAPDIVLPTMAHMWRLHLGGDHPYGFRTAYNPTYPDPAGSARGWVSPYHCGLNQGPIVVMIENYRSGLIWRLLRGHPRVVAGLRAADFNGGWLSPPGPHGDSQVTS
ncbi:MAG: glucoamylase family protein [Gemmatimonadaceae bacterium]